VVKVKVGVGLVAEVTVEEGAGKVVGMVGVMVMAARVRWKFDL
jgi:hypothetical protein